VIQRYSQRHLLSAFPPHGTSIIINNHLLTAYLQQTADRLPLTIKRLKRLKPSTALNGKPITELRSVTCHMGSHKRTHPAITPTKQAGTRFTYLGRMEGWDRWVDLGSLIAARPGIEPTTVWSQVRHPNHFANESPNNTRYSGHIIIIIITTLATSKLSAVFSSIIDMTRLPIVSFKFHTWKQTYGQ